MEECTEETNNPRIVLEEKGKKMTFINEHRQTVRKIKVDGCAIKKGIRCDWLVINEADCEHFVELKGSDLRHACEQLRESIIQLSKNAYKSVKFAFAIAGKVSPKLRTSIQVEQAKFKKRYNCKLEVKNTPFTSNL